MVDCIFCKLVSGDIPGRKIAESTNFIAFLDIAPVAPGHTLIVPKKHSTNFLDFPEYSGNEFVEFTQRVASAVLSTVGGDGFNLVLNNGAAAGQIVFHTHFHIVPRKDNDGLHVAFGEHQDATREQLLELERAVVKRLTLR